MPDEQPTAPDAQAAASAQPTAQGAQAPAAEQSTSPDTQVAAGQQSSARGEQETAAAAQSPQAGGHVRKPMDPTGLASVAPPTIAVAIACTVYGWLGLHHVTGSWVIAPALVTLVTGLLIVAGYMELLTGAPASLEEQFDEHTLSEDDVHVHGLTAHDLPLDNPVRAELLSRTPGTAARQAPAVATAQAGSDLARGASS